MAAASTSTAADDARLQQCAFAKLVGPQVGEVCIRQYEVTLGRRSDNQEVDIVLGDSKSLSRKMAAIRYNFDSKSWELQVFGKNGVSINDTLYTASSPPQALRSQDRLRFGVITAHFLLPRVAKKAKRPRPAAAPAAAAAGAGSVGAGSVGALLPGASSVGASLPGVGLSREGTPGATVSGGAGYTGQQQQGQQQQWQGQGVQQLSGAMSGAAVSTGSGLTGGAGSGLGPSRQMESSGLASGSGYGYGGDDMEADAEQQEQQEQHGQQEQQEWQGFGGVQQWPGAPMQQQQQQQQQQPPGGFPVMQSWGNYHPAGNGSLG